MHSAFSSRGVSIRIDQSEPVTAQPHPAILLLHGAGGNTTFWPDRLAPLTTRLGVALYAPHYFDRTQTPWADPATILDGVHVPLWLETVADALAYVRTRPNVDAERIVLVGISLGAFLALAHAATHEGIRAIVEISGGLVEPYASRATHVFPPTLILHGDRDQVVSVDLAGSLATLLERLHVPHEQTILTGEGHRLSQAAQSRILAATAAFLARYL